MKSTAKSPKDKTTATRKDLPVKDTRAVTGGKVNVQDLSFTKYIDKSTPELML